MSDIHHRNIENYDEIWNSADIVFLINGMNAMKIFNEALQVVDKAEALISQKLHSGGSLRENSRKMFNVVFNLKFVQEIVMMTKDVVLKVYKYWCPTRICAMTYIIFIAYIRYYNSKQYTDDTALIRSIKSSDALTKKAVLGCKGRHIVDPTVCCQQ